MQIQEISYIRPKSLSQLVIIQLSTQFLLHQNLAWELKFDSWIKLWFSSYQQVVFPCWLEFYAWLLAEYYYFSNVLDSILIFLVGESAETVYTPHLPGVLFQTNNAAVNLKFEMEMLCNDWYFWAPCLQHDLEMNQFVLCCKGRIPGYFVPLRNKTVTLVFSCWLWIRVWLIYEDQL